MGFQTFKLERKRERASLERKRNPSVMRRCRRRTQFCVN
jgi:hypothetical protein